MKQYFDFEKIRKLKGEIYEVRMIPRIDRLVSIILDENIKNVSLICYDVTETPLKATARLINEQVRRSLISRICFIIDIYHYYQKCAYITVIRKCEYDKIIIVISPYYIGE